MSHVLQDIPEYFQWKRLDAMDEWHEARSIRAMRGRSWRDANDRNDVTWSFADAAMASGSPTSFVRS